MPKKIIFYIFAVALGLLLYSPLSYCNFGKLGLGIGLLNPHMGEMQKNLAGDKQNTNIHAYLNSKLSYKLPKQFEIAIHGAWGIPQSSRDKDISKSYHFANLYLSYGLDNFDFFIGPGLLFTRISGDGGTKTLNNGNSTSQFFLPSTSSLASNITINLGVGYTLVSEYSGMFQAIWTNPTVKERRSISLALSFLYLWDIFDSGTRGNK